MVSVIQHMQRMYVVEIALDLSSYATWLSKANPTQEEDTGFRVRDLSQMTLFWPFWFRKYLMKGITHTWFWPHFVSISFNCGRGAALLSV